MQLTPFNPLKILRHSERIALMLHGETVYPISVELDLANVCNHHCPWCSFNGFRQDNWVRFPTPRAITLLEELAEVGVKSITFTGGGEPLVHQNAADIFHKAHRCGMQFGVVTNGRRLEGPAADMIAAYATFVRVSLDAGTAQTHQLLHATATPEFERILENMRRLRALAGSRALTIGASMCVFDVNRHEIHDAAARVKDVGADYLEVRPVFPTEWRGGGFSQPLTNELVADAREALEIAQAWHNDERFRVIGMVQRFDQLTDATKPYTKCRIGPLTTVINADGNIYHCCIQRGMPAFVAGSVLNRPFKDVWQSAAHKAMVEAIDITKCPPCRYDGYNELIEKAFLADGLHANFV